MPPLQLCRERPGDFNRLFQRFCLELQHVLPCTDRTLIHRTMVERLRGPVTALIDQAKEAGSIRADVNFSDWDCTLERNESGELCLRLGLRQVDGCTKHHAERVMEERGYGYPNFADFARRTALPKSALIALAEADTFRGFGLDRREGLWAVRRLPDDSPLPLFAPRATPEMGPESIARPPIEQTPLAMACSSM